MIGWEAVDGRRYNRVQAGQKVFLVPFGHEVAPDNVEYAVPLGYWERNPVKESEVTLFV